MLRRTFFQMFGMAAAAFVLDPEKLLWVPGAKTIFVPDSLKMVTLDEINSIAFSVVAEYASTEEQYNYYINAAQLLRAK